MSWCVLVVHGSYWKPLIIRCASVGLEICSTSKQSRHLAILPNALTGCVGLTHCPPRINAFPQSIEKVYDGICCMGSHGISMNPGLTLLFAPPDSKSHLHVEIKKIGAVLRVIHKTDASLNVNYF